MKLLSLFLLALVWASASPSLAQDYPNGAGKAVPGVGLICVGVGPCGTAANPLVVSGSGATSGGATPAHYLSAASTNATNVKASAGNVYALAVINTTATLYYLKLYDKATAPTCNSDAVLQTYPVPASTAGAGFVLPLNVGMSFSAGIGFCLTGGLADNDNTNAATGVAINFVYK
jgi:hypothetical protein